MSDPAKRILKRCHELAAISESPDGILRQYLTPEHKEANALVSRWMTAAGMTAWTDSVGNQWGRLESRNPEAKRLIIGSHLDTVPNAGAYDGILGVLLGIEAAGCLSAASVDLPFHLDVVGFCDEEGTRFGTTLIGSKALAGAFSPEWLSLRDKAGITLASAMQVFGLDADDAGSSALDAADVLCFMEAHIEQGPVLDSRGLSLGIVTGIAGARRATFHFNGKAGHAGTTPMPIRQDAFTAGCEWALFVESLLKEQSGEAVATVGQVEVSPSAVNVIPGRAVFSLDVRAPDDGLRDRLCTEIERQARTIATKRKVACQIEWTHEAKAVPCDDRLQAELERAFLATGHPCRTLPSGAGHDAMAMSALCPMGMLFVRSPGGISHHPDEQVDWVDVSAALDVLVEWLSKKLTTWPSNCIDESYLC